MNFNLVELCAKADNLTPQERALLVILCDYANQDGVCWPSYETLSKRLCLQRRQTMKHVKNLLDKAILIKVELEPKPKFSTSNIYKINAERLKELTKKEPEIRKNTSALENTSSELEVHSSTPEANYGVHSNTLGLVHYSTPGLVHCSAPEVNTFEVNTIEVNNSCPKPSVVGQKTTTDVLKNEKRLAEKERSKIIQEKFDEFWSLYPRKVGKKKCESKFTSLVRKKIELADEILSGLTSQLETLKMKEVEYIPHPFTWLNQGRWEDELPKKEDWRL